MAPIAAVSPLWAVKAGKEAHIEPGGIDSSTLIIKDYSAVGRKLGKLMGECICLMLAYIFLNVSDKPESKRMARALCTPQRPEKAARQMLDRR